MSIHRPRRAVPSLVFGALAVGVLCAGPAHADQACGKRGGTLTYTYAAEPVALSTLKTTSVPVAIIATKIYEGLLKYGGPQLTPEPGLAKSWDISADRLTYTFHLRDDVTWQDGVPFTSADVKATIEQAILPYHTRGKVFFGEVANIATPDRYTVVFKLKKPVPYFMQAFHASNTPIFAKHIMDTIDMKDRNAVMNSSLVNHPVGTGPFELRKWAPGRDIILDRNPNYWDKPFPCLDHIVMRIIPDGEARAVALKTGEVDLAPMNSIPYADIQTFASSTNFTVTTKGTEGLGTDMWLDVNNRTGPLANPLVRNAISDAMDREKIINIIWYGYGIPSRGPLVSTNPFFDKNLPPLTYNMRKAAQLLDRAGYPVKADGERFAITQYYLPYGAQYQRLAEYIRLQLGKLGIKVTTESLDIGGWLNKVFNQWDYQMTSTFTDNRNDPTVGTERIFTTSFIKKGATFENSMGYSNPKVDELFAAGALETDLQKRKEDFDQAQEIIQKDMPVIFLVELANVSIWNKRVHGILTNGLSSYGTWAHVWMN